MTFFLSVLAIFVVSIIANIIALYRSKQVSDHIDLGGN